MIRVQSKDQTGMKRIFGGFNGCQKMAFVSHALPRELLSIYWYTYMCLPFGVYFHEIWYIDGWVSVTDPMHPIFPKKHPIYVFMVFGILKGPKIVLC